MHLWLFMWLLQPTMVWAHSLYPSVIALSIFGLLGILLIWAIYRLIKYLYSKSKSKL